MKIQLFYSLAVIAVIAFIMIFGLMTVEGQISELKTEVADLKEQIQEQIQEDRYVKVQTAMEYAIANGYSIDYLRGPHGTGQSLLSESILDNQEVFSEFYKNNIMKIAPGEDVYEFIHSTFSGWDFFRTKLPVDRLTAKGICYQLAYLRLKSYEDGVRQRDWPLANYIEY